MAPKGFDDWAKDYEKTVERTDEKGEYPFAGYHKLLSEIERQVIKRKSGKILDLGIGTGKLAKKLYDANFEMTGLDFSSKMIEVAREKMPEAHFIIHDFSNGLPEELKEKSYDVIISTYTFHHLEKEKQTSLLKELVPLLKNYGILYIGDILFETREDLEACKNKYSDLWDDDEIYFVFEELENLKKEVTIKFTKISHCAGILEISKD